MGSLKERMDHTQTRITTTYSFCLITFNLHQINMEIHRDFP
jgi:hypothetical protein